MKSILTDFLFRDVKNENETKRIAVLLRLNVILMWAYHFLMTALFFLSGFHSEALASVVCFAAFSFIFYTTYQDATRTAVLLSHATTLLWILFTVYMVGWDSGVQHLIFVLIMMGFLTSMAALKWKVLYAFLLCALRLALYFYTLNRVPFTQLPYHISIAFQVINTCAVCSMITISLCLYNRDSLNMEQKLIAYNEKLHKLALLDPLTGLYNRRGIQEYLESKALEYQQEKLSNLCIAIGDIDFFKSINDRYGHDCGDQVLKELGALFDSAVQGKGRVGRWGGEEFLFVLPMLNGDEACVLLQKLQAAIRELTITYKEYQIHITLTFGVAEYDCHESLDCSIGDADKKLYLGKEMGRNRVVY